MIGDMIFGTTPLAYKGMNTKVHYKRDKEPQVVLSKLFTLNPVGTDPTRRTSFSSVNSDWSTASSTTPTAEEYYAKSIQSVSLDDNGSERGSSDDDKASRHVPSVCDLRSRQQQHSFSSKRSRRFSQTSMENGVFKPTPLPNTHEGPNSVESSSSSNGVSLS